MRSSSPDEPGCSDESGGVLGTEEEALLGNDRRDGEVNDEGKGERLVGGGDEPRH